MLREKPPNWWSNSKLSVLDSYTDWACCIDEHTQLKKRRQKFERQQVWKSTWGREDRIKGCLKIVQLHFYFRKKQQKISAHVQVKDNTFHWLYTTNTCTMLVISPNTHDILPVTCLVSYASSHNWHDWVWWHLAGAAKIREQRDEFGPAS